MNNEGKKRIATVLYSRYLFASFRVHAESTTRLAVRSLFIRLMYIYLNSSWIRRIYSRNAQGILEVMLFEQKMELLPIY